MFSKTIHEANERLEYVTIKATKNCKRNYTKFLKVIIKMNVEEVLKMIKFQYTILKKWHKRSNLKSFSLCAFVIYFERLCGKLFLKFNSQSLVITFSEKFI